MGTFFYLICALITVAHALDAVQQEQHAPEHKHAVQQEQHAPEHKDAVQQEQHAPEHKDAVQQEQHAHEHKDAGHQEQHAPECKDAKDHAHSTTLHKIVAANTHFAFDLYKHCASSSHSKNIFFSPFSISTAFSMLSEGAKAKTHDEILEGLRYNLTNINTEAIHNGYKNILLSLAKPKRELIVNVGNALFLEEHVHLLEHFKKAVQSHYHAEIQMLNPSSSDAAVKQINDYVEKHTNGKIADLLKELDKDTKLVLLNYVYFKGKWQYPFSSEDTRTEKFSVSENVTVKVPMMSQTKYHTYLTDKELPCSVVKLPYQGEAHMLLILPNPGKMEEVEAALSQETLQRWKRQMSEGYIELSVPKFSMSYSMELKELLIAMGIKDVFSDHADLSGIADGPPLKVGKAAHKAKLDVNEEGTEASAATVIDIVPESLWPVFKADHPFIFMIISDADKHILFLGKVVNPLEK